VEDDGSIDEDGETLDPTRAHDPDGAGALRAFTQRLSRVMPGKRRRLSSGGFGDNGLKTGSRFGEVTVRWAVFLT
jgi:hypothetical protein